MFESVQGVHTFTGTATAFFIPALATCLWSLTCKKLLTQTLHVTAVLYVRKVGCAQLKLVACVI
jgi:hypothetical protein